MTTSRGFSAARLASTVSKLAIGALAVSSIAVAFAASKTYTTTADFDAGTKVGVNTAGNEIKLSTSGSTFPVLWVANAGEDSLTKFDTVNDKEVARYRTWFGPSGQAGHSPHLGNAFAGAAPSRTAVDVDGNAYILNRHFDGRSAVLIKILANEFVDRNSNGVPDTSSDTDANGIISGAEMKPLADTNGNGVIDDSEIQDERIAWAKRVPDGIGAPFVNGQLGRSLCIAPNGNLWVGLYSAQAYYEVSGVDGHTLRGPVGVGVTPYGCLVDAQNRLWSADLGSGMGRIDTVAGTSQGRVNLINQTYGIAIDNDYVYYASQSTTSYLRVHKTTLAQDTPAKGVQFYSLGISVDGDGNIVTGRYQGGGITKYKGGSDASSGDVLCTAAGQGNMNETRGVIADANGNIWQISVSGNIIAKYSPSCAPLGTFPVGNSPYTYSDAAGLAARSITSRTGDWSITYDSGAGGTPWGKVLWNAVVPTGASLIFSTRASDTLLSLGSLPFVDVGNGADFSQAGRFLEVRARLGASISGVTPVVADVTVRSLTNTCDIDIDGDIDTADLGLIRAGIGQTPAANDPRDANGDGRITINDMRYCTLRCTRPGCGQ